MIGNDTSPMPTAETARSIDWLYRAYAAALNDEAFERWPEFFVDDALYLVTTRENVAQNYPLGLIRCEDNAMRRDRVSAIRDTAMYVARPMRRSFANIVVTRTDGNVVDARADFIVLETFSREPTRLFVAGVSEDRIVMEPGGALFAERRCIIDSDVIPTSLIYPL